MAYFAYGAAPNREEREACLRSFFRGHRTHCGLRMNKKTRAWWLGSRLVAAILSCRFRLRPFGSNRERFRLSPRTPRAMRGFLLQSSELVDGSFRQNEYRTVAEDRNIAEVKQLREQAESILRERLVLLHLLRHAVEHRRELLPQVERTLQELRSAKSDGQKLRRVPR